MFPHSINILLCKFCGESELYSVSWFFLTLCKCCARRYLNGNWCPAESMLGTEAKDDAQKSVSFLVSNSKPFTLKSVKSEKCITWYPFTLLYRKKEGSDERRIVACICTHPYTLAMEQFCTRCKIVIAVVKFHGQIGANGLQVTVQCNDRWFAWMVNREQYNCIGKKKRTSKMFNENNWMASFCIKMIFINDHSCLNDN